MAFEVRRTFLHWPEGPSGNDGRGTGVRYPVGVEEVIFSHNNNIGLAEKNILQDIALELDAMDTEKYTFLEATFSTYEAPNVDGIPGCHRMAQVQDNHGQYIPPDPETGDWVHVGVLYYLVEV